MGWVGWFSRVRVRVGLGVPARSGWVGLDDGGLGEGGLGWFCLVDLGCLGWAGLGWLGWAG